VMYCRAEV